MAKGVARNTKENLEWLTACDAVTAFSAKNEDPVVNFTYDDGAAPAEVPEGIWFDLSEAPF